MHDHRTKLYTAFLRRRLQDDRLFVEADADSRNTGKRAYWVKYRLAGHLPIKLVTVSEFDEFWFGPGEWLLHLMATMDWRWMIESAKVSFSKEYDERRALGIDTAQRVPF